MPGVIGKILISLSFVAALAAMASYWYASQYNRQKVYRLGNLFFCLKGLFLLAASAVLVWLIFQHQFQYYYVFNYTSLDLAPKYLWSAFYGGQEGSFMLWILFSWLLGFGLMKWTRPPYKSAVLFFLAFTQVFLLSMILGWDLGENVKLGASPFRTIAEEMPNAPFLQANPDFVPADGTGLNDLLKSPWMMIHPPLLFLGFSMMTIPFCFALASLWKRKYNEWVSPALPWTLGANVALLTAIFLGGYWAYVTLSFGGFWAWDPVENASLVPWLFGTAGIHTMIIQRKSSIAQKSSILFAILAYLAIVYETFLTRSGILADSSVHSFVDLGLYNQLLAFMAATTIIGLGMFLYRYKELPSPQKESKILSREFMTFSGAVMLLILGLVIILGTSSPIIGKLFSENPTPPEISFYNEWSMPIAIIMAVLTVVGQYLFWKKQDAESLASELMNPLLITSAATLATIFLGDIRDFYKMIYLFAAYFAVIGNGFMVVKLARKNPKVIGGALTHVGFGVLLIGVLISSTYNKPLLDQRTIDYNAAIERGEVTDEQGFTVTQPVTLLELKLGQPKIINNKYIATYEGYSLKNQNRPGQQTYKIKFEDLDGENAFYMYPEVYPMLATSSAENVEWSVDPDVHTGLIRDIYLYVAGSSYVEERNEEIEKRAPFQPVSNNDEQEEEEPNVEKITLSRGQSVGLGGFKFRFVNYIKADTTKFPDNTIIGVKAEVEVSHAATGELYTVEPLFAVYAEDGKNFTYAPPEGIPGDDLLVQFTRISTQEDRIELTLTNVPEEEEWVLIAAEHKPLISVVWLGTFLLMGGFSVSIMRHWSREKNKN